MSNDPTLAYMNGEECLPEEASDDSAGTDLSLVPMPINPSVRKVLDRTNSAASTARNAVDTHMEKRPDIAIRFQKNEIAIYKLQLELLRFNAELHGKGAGVDSSSADKPHNQYNNQFNFGNEEGLDIVSKILSGQRVVEESPRGIARESSSGDGS